MKCEHCYEKHKNNNAGCENSGYWNTGNCNSGYWNTGNCNSGDMNSGYWNSGDWNSGYWNSGDRNSGYWNSGDGNTGYFNTGSPNKIQVFNEWIEMTNEEFEQKYNIHADLPLTTWINEEDMSEEEKEKVVGWEEMGGYLKTLDFKEACVIWWNKNPHRHDDFLNLPNFNSEIFKEITGIDVEKKDNAEQEAIELLKKNGYKIVKEVDNQ